MNPTVSCSGPAARAIPVMAFGHAVTPAAGRMAARAPATPLGSRVRAAVERAVATGRASYRGVLRALPVAAAARSVADQ
jgi:hypothetical protein